VVNTINNTLGTITLTLLATSPQISTLLADAEAGTYGSLYVSNAHLGTTVGGATARIKSYPELSYGAEVGEREFEFQVFDYKEEAK